MIFERETDGLSVYPKICERTENPLESIERAIAFDAKDWSTDRRSAWIYAIVFGWEEAEEEIWRIYGWNEAEKERANRLHKKWQHIKKQTEEEEQTEQ